MVRLVRFQPDQLLEQSKFGQVVWSGWSVDLSSIKSFPVTVRSAYYEQILHFRYISMNKNDKNKPIE